MILAAKSAQQHAIRELRRSTPNVLDVEMLDSGHLVFLLLDRDPRFEQQMRESMPPEMILEFQTFEQLLERGRTLMEHFSGI